MRIGNNQLILLLGTVVSLTVVFNNCEPHRFQASVEALKTALDASGGIAINGGAPTTTSDDVVLTISNPSAKEMYVTNSPDCRDGGQWEPMAQTKAWKLAKKNVNAEVFVKFREGSSEGVNSSCISDSIVHDDIPPVVKITNGVAAFINRNNATIDFEAIDGGSGIDIVTCLNDASGSPLKCSTSHSRASLNEGPHSVEIVAYDKAGNRSVPELVAFTVDRTPPTLTMNLQPSKLTNIARSEFRFSAVDTLSGVDRYECQMGATGAWAACSSPSVSTLASGSHVFAVRAFDKAGNMAAPISYDWVIDMNAPSVMITKAPSPISKDANSIFEFSGSDSGQPITRFECSVDQAAAVACASPYPVNGLAAGTHVFSVVGVDAAGNRSSPAVYTWLIDLTPPTVQFTQTPAKNANSTNANFAFTAADPGSGIARIECQLDGGNYQACASPTALANLTEAEHAYSVRAVDNAGNVSQPVSYTWRVDVTKPMVEITSGPTGYVGVNTADLAYVGTDGGSGIARYECGLDSGAWQTCVSPTNFMALAEGSHLFVVRAVDNAGNVSDPKSRQWYVDRTGPAINFQKMPLATIQTYETAVVQFTVTDAGSGVMTVTCGLNGSLVSCRESDSYTYANPMPGNYVFTVKATDKLGNESMNSVSWTVKQDTVVKTQLVMVNENKKIDVMVVIDNSGSMAYEQANMAQRFGTFLDQLAGYNWQVGIVTTDVSGDAVRKDGRLLELSGMTGQYVLNSSMPLANAKTAFAATIQRPANEGSGNEQGIAASVRAIQRSQAPTVAVNAPNVALFRADAALAAIVVTDADETNPAGTQSQNMPQTLVNLVKATWSAKAFAFHSIIVKPGDTACVGINGNEGYGYAYDSLSKLTGGLIGSVCETDYAAQLKNIGVKTVELVRSANLECPPLDTNGDGKADVAIVTADMSPAPGYVIEGMKITFDKALPLGNNTLTYTCLK